MTKTRALSCRASDTLVWSRETPAPRSERAFLGDQNHRWRGLSSNRCSVEDLDIGAIIAAPDLAVSSSALQTVLGALH
jgi:hypothetical protein